MRVQHLQDREWDEQSQREPDAMAAPDATGELGSADRRLLERALAAHGEDEE